MNEIWKNAVGYEGLYEVSNLGRVRSVDRYDSLGHFRESIILRQHLDHNGYKFVALFKDGKRKSIKIHRIVAMAFIPNPNNLPQVNHIDENKINNNVDNLEWCDCKYNCNYGTRNERTAKARINHPNTSKQVILIDLNNGKSFIFPSLSECSREKYLDLRNLSKVCLGKQHSISNKNGDRFTATYVPCH